jgi:hypothetical protein
MPINKFIYKQIRLSGTHYCEEPKKNHRGNGGRSINLKSFYTNFLCQFCANNTNIFEYIPFIPYSRTPIN